jgi:hypothetical protein
MNDMSASTSWRFHASANACKTSTVIPGRVSGMIDLFLQAFVQTQLPHGHRVEFASLVVEASQQTGRHIASSGWPG